MSEMEMILHCDNFQQSSAPWRRKDTRKQEKGYKSLFQIIT